MRRWTKGMRDVFFDALFDIAKKDKRVTLITADTGAICHEGFRKKLRNQYINIGVAEQNMIGVAAGLAMAGKIVYAYSIIPFITSRCHEQIKIDLCSMDLPVTIVGIGSGLDYSTLGHTHHGTEDIALMRVLPGMKIYIPSDNVMASLFAKVAYQESGPKYIRLDRQGLPLVYRAGRGIDVSRGFSVLKKGSMGYIIATGRMVYTGLEVSRKLAKRSIGMGVIDLFRIKPLGIQRLWNIIKHAACVVTLEEHFVIGGIGSIIAEILANKKNNIMFKGIGIPDRFCREYGSRDYLQAMNKIDPDSVTGCIESLVRK